MGNQQIKGNNELLEDVHVRMPRQMIADLQYEARRNNTNLSEMIRIIMNSYFEGQISDVVLINDTITQQQMKLNALDKKIEVSTNFLLCFIRLLIENLPSSNLDFSDEQSDYNYRRFVDSALAKMKKDRPSILQETILNYMQEN